MADQKTQVLITADAGQANREFAAFSANVQAASRAALGSLGGLRDTILGLHGKVAALAGLVAGSMFARMVQGAAESAAGLHDMAMQTGMSVEALSGLASVGKLSETSLQTIAAASNKLSAGMAKVGEGGGGAAAAVRALGIDFKAFQAMSPEERMQAVAQAMGQFADGSGKTAAAIALFGKAGAEMLPFMADLAEAGKLQVKMTKEQAAASDEYTDNLVRLRGQSEAWKKTLANAMIPAMRDASAAFLEVFTRTGGLQDKIKGLAADGSIDRWARGAINAFTYVVDVVNVARMAIQSMATTALAGFDLVNRGAQSFSSVVGKIMAGDFAGAEVELKAAHNRSVGIAKKWSADMAAIWAPDSAQIGQRMREAFEKAGKAPAVGKPTKPKLDFTNGAEKPDKGASGSDPSRVSQWEADLAERKAALTRQGLVEGQYREMSKADELAYWQAIKGMQGLSTQERLAVTRKAAEVDMAMVRETFEVKVAALHAEAAAYRANVDARIAIEQRIQGMYAAGTKEFEAAQKRIQALQRSKAEQDEQVRQVRLQAERDASLAEVEIAAQSMAELQRLGLVDQEQVLAAEMQFEQRRHQIALDALQQRLQLMQADPDRNPVELARIQAQIEALELQHQARMGKLQSDARVESASRITDTLQTIRGGWASLLQQLASGTLTISGFIRGVFRVVAESVVQTLAQLAAKWAVQQLAMVLFGKTAAVSEIGAAAATAGANGVASMAGAPFPLNMSAPFFGAAMAAEALMYAPAVSAARGFDVPPNVNPVGQLHASEMVLPATLANTVRDMAQVYQQAGAQGNRAGGEVVLNVQGLPIGQFIAIHQREFLAAIKAARKAEHYNGKL